MNIANSNTKGIAFAILRITMGVNIFFHGAVRLPKIAGFRTWMLSQFKETLIPEWSVYVWGTLLPFLEAIVGLFLIIGLFTLRSSIAGALTITVLILGSCLAENWAWAGGQMTYALFYFFIIYYIENNIWAIDNLINKKNKYKNHKYINK